MQLSAHLQRSFGASSKTSLLAIFILFAIIVEGQKVSLELSIDSRFSEVISEKSQQEIFPKNNATYQIVSSQIFQWIARFSNKAISLIKKSPIPPILFQSSSFKITQQLKMPNKEYLVDLNLLITGGSGGGVWSQLETNPMILTSNKNNIVDFKIAVTGTYIFRYTQSAIGYSDVKTDVEILVIASVAPCPSAPCNGVWNGNN